LNVVQVFLNTVHKICRKGWGLLKQTESKDISRPDRLRERILDAAERTIAEKGLSGLKAREVAQAAGCALGAIYTVFADLDEVILRVGARTLARLEKELSAPGEGDALERLALAYLGFARREEPSWRALFGHRLPRETPLPEWFATERDRLFTLLEAPLSVLLPDRAAGEVKREARTLFSAVHGIVALGLEEKLGGSARELLDSDLRDFIALISRGLAAASAESASEKSGRGNRRT
jgi:AcrR family transcriptional regulator